MNLWKRKLLFYRYRYNAKLLFLVFIKCHWRKQTQQAVGEVAGLTCVSSDTGLPHQAWLLLVSGGGDRWLLQAITPPLSTTRGLLCDCVSHLIGASLLGPLICFSLAPPVRRGPTFGRNEWGQTVVLLKRRLLSPRAAWGITILLSGKSGDLLNSDSGSMW